jgi:hypothetical protein
MHSIWLMLSSKGGSGPGGTGPLEAAGAFPVGDGAVELGLLPASGVDVVVDDVVAEGRAQHRRAVEGLGGGAQRGWDLGQRAVVIGVAAELGAELEPRLDAGEAGGELGGEGEVGVEIGAADPALDPHGGRVGADESEAGGAVVGRPDRAGRGEGAGDEALVAVDVRGEEDRRLGGVGEQAGEVAAHRARHAVRFAPVEEHRRAARVAQRLVDVAGGAGGGAVVLGHEGDGAALAPGDLLDRVLGDDVGVGGGERAVVADVDLLLAGAGLALGGFHRNAGGVQPGADRPHHVFLLGGLEDVIVLVVGADRREAAVAGGVQRLERLGEQEELELGGHQRLEAHRLQPGELALQDRARRMRHLGVAMVVEHVGEHQRGALEPGRAAQRGEVGFHRVVAVAGGPARRLVARHRLHLVVGGEQVVAAVGLAVGAREEELGLEALAH